MTSAPFLRFPLDILIEINHYLTRQDRYQLCLVNRVLNENCKDFLFTSITLCKQYQLYNVFHLMSLEPHLFLKTNKLEVGYYNQNRYPLINALQCCPNLTMLKIGRANGLFRRDQPTDFNDYPVLSRLIELDIDCDYLTSMENLLSFFSRCPNVKSLKLWKLNRLASPAQVERLHHVFHRLEELYLDSGYLNNDMASPDPITDAPCVFMKKITFTVSGTWNDFILWIRYIAQKYPNIESLDISSKQNYFTDRNILLEEIQSTIRLLFDSCRNLSSIRLDNVWWIDTFLLCYLDEEQRRSSSIEKVEISSSPYGLSTELFGLLSRSIIPLIKVLDITLCTQIINNPVLLSWGLRSGSMLTDLRISVSRNGSSPLSLLSIHWILESCPSLLSITLDSGFLDIVNDALTGLPPSTVQSHHLERLAVKNCTFNNEVWSYIEKKCPRLNWLSIDKGLLYDGSLFPSIQLKFPNHVFKSIIINRVRCPRMPVDVRPSPSFGSPIYNKPTWDEGWLPIEFMTIQRRQHPTLSACSDNNGVLSTQNDTIQQTFQALDMKFIDQRYNYNGNFTMTPQNLFGYFERLLQAKRLTAQGVLYYQRECKIPIPDPSSNNSTISSSSSKRRKFDRQKEQVRQKWEEQEQLANESTRFQRVQRRQQQHIPATDRGGHIFVDVYGVTDLIINEKWIILQGQ